MRKITLLLFFGLALATGYTQQSDSLGGRWLEPADTFQPGRFWALAGSGTVAYGAVTYGLYQIWYRDYPRTSFHTFDDWGEWNQMDKAGHVLATYNYARFVYSGARWTGMSPGASRWTAFGIANLLQGTVELLDGYSSEWGFSWTDMGANLLGSTTFLVQDMLWQEQRMQFKLSTNFRPHPDVQVLSNNKTTYDNLGRHNRELYGDSFAERFIKDYNTMNLWLSITPRGFLGERSRFPPWLSFAVGYSVENVYGAYFNSWSDPAGNRYGLSTDLYPRHRQYLFSPDIDLTQIKTRKRWLKTLFVFANSIKFPAPALEYNSLGEVKWHWLYF